VLSEKWITETRFGRLTHIVMEVIAWLRLSVKRATEARVREWQVRMEAYYLVEAVCEPSHGGQGERLAGKDGGSLPG
jgi:hypothetical protein